MDKLEIMVYILFAISIFFAFGLTIPAIIILLIASLIVERKIKKYNPEKAKKLRMITIIVLVIIGILYILPGILTSIWLTGLFS